MDLGIALETIVGARVGVWWDEDETYYKVRSSSCAAQIRGLAMATFVSSGKWRVVLPRHALLTFLQGA